MIYKLYALARLRRNYHPPMDTRRQGQGQDRQINLNMSYTNTTQLYVYYFNVEWFIHASDPWLSHILAGVPMMCVLREQPATNWIQNMKQNEMSKDESDIYIYIYILYIEVDCESWEFVFYVHVAHTYHVRSFKLNDMKIYSLISLCNTHCVC